MKTDVLVQPFLRLLESRNPPFVIYPYFLIFGPVLTVLMIE